MGLVALFACFFVIMIFLKFDRKEWPGFSNWLWIPLLWLLFTSTRIISILFPIQSNQEIISQYLEGNVYNRVIFSLLILIALAVLLKNKNFFNIKKKINTWMIVLYLFALLSMMWAVYSLVSFKRWIMIFGHLLMVYLVFNHEDNQKAFEHLLRRYFFIITTLSLLLVKFFKNLGFERTVHGTKVWAGVMTHKNELGAACALAIIFAIWRFIKNKNWTIMFEAVVLLISFYLMIRSGSATAIILALLGILLLFVVSKYDINKIKKLFAVYVIAFILIMIIWQDFFSNTLTSLFSALGRETTLTGRIPMWRDLIKMGSKHFWLGCGYENFWLTNFSQVWSKYSFRPNQAHNGYIEIFLNLGLIGFILFMIYLINGFRKVIGLMEGDKGFYGLIMVYVIMILFNNITEAFFLKPNLEWFLLLYMGVVGIESKDFTANT